MFNQEISHHVGDAAVSAAWSRVSNDLIFRLTQLYPKNFVGVEVTNWERIGNYAIRFEFSDGHRTGLYSYELLRQLGESAGKV